MRVGLDRMKFFIGFLILLNFIYFLWPKDEVQARPEYQRGNDGVSMLLRIDEQEKPPSFESRVPEIYDPLVKQEPAVQDVNASFVQPEIGTKNNDQVTSVDNLNYVADGVSLGNVQVNSDSETATSNTSSFDPESELVDAKSDAKVDSEAQVEFLAKAENVDQANTEVKADAEFETQIEAESEAEVDTGVQTSEAPQCVSLGPFKKSKTAKKILADIDAMGLQSVIRDTTEKQKIRFWVYLPPYPSRQKAVDAAEKLATLGIDEYFIISDGNNDNAISLGIFKKKSDSDRRIKEINALGYTPKVDVSSKEVSVFWIDTQTTKEVDWVSFLNQRFPKGGIENQQRSCG
jgi:cell division protein FtsN